MMRTDSLIDKRNWAKDSLKINWDIILTMFMGFLLTRASILNKLTPFGFAFLAAYIIVKGRNMPLLLSVAFGTLTYMKTNGLMYLLAYVSLYSYFYVVKKGKNYSLIKASLVSAIILFSFRVMGIVFGKTFFLYDLFMIIFESVLAFTMIYIFSFSLPIEKIRGTNFNNEKIICSFIVFALAIAGFNNMVVLGVSIKNIISLAIILFISYNQGALMGGTTGIILGMIGYISHPEMPFIIGIFGIAGLLAGIFKDLGKSGSALGLLLGNGIMSFYINGLGTSFLSYKEILFAIFLFIISSKNIHEKINGIFTVNLNTKKDFIQKRDEVVIRKLGRMAELFNNLSSTFKASASDLDLGNSQEVYGIVDGVANNICKHCYKFDKCWGKSYYGTFHKMLNLVGHIEMKAGKDKSIYVDAKKHCIRFGDLIEEIKRSVELLKLNQSWNIRLNENRLLLSEQLQGLGKIVENLTKDIYGNSTFNEDIEQNIYKELKNNRIDVAEVSVTQIGEEDFEIFIDLNSTSNAFENNKIKYIVSECLGYPVVSDKNFREHGKVHRFKLIRSNRYSAITKSVSAVNSEGKISGDNFTFGEIENLHYAAISDGMGIGKRANEESKVAISLLERLMEANVDKDLTLKTINSVLRARTDDEIFTTLDLSFIDLYSGKLQMIKNGAPPTFIKKKDRVDIINASSLPVGILKDIDFNIYEEYITDGDIIIMMSDGILEGNRNVENVEAWMKDVIMNIQSLNPQTIAKEILKEAKDGVSNSRDDMTVLVTKVWKNV